MLGNVGMTLYEVNKRLLYYDNISLIYDEQQLLLTETPSNSAKLSGLSYCIYAGDTGKVRHLLCILVEKTTFNKHFVNFSLNATKFGMLINIVAIDK